MLSQGLSVLPEIFRQGACILDNNYLIVIGYEQGKGAAIFRNLFAFFYYQKHSFVPEGSEEK